MRLARDQCEKMGLLLQLVKQREGQGELNFRRHSIVAKEDHHHFSSSKLERMSWLFW